ncbi:MAG: hypothetical protein HOV80_02560 [Polyangiaceae bacterium]|nr:hypothetical protein [Polyangiaceae bacterium]
MKAHTALPVMLAAALVACGDPAPTADKAASASPSSSGPAASTASAAPRQPADIEPVYPKVAGPPHPLAERMCRAVQSKPAARKAECCGDAAPAMMLPERECIRMLSFAVADGSITIDEKALAACEAETEKRLEGCGWVGLTPPSTPAACQGFLVGTLTESKACRSSLECEKDLRCYGLSATQKGKCAPARPAGAICGTGGDPLAAIARQNDVDSTHKECVGHCKQTRCNDDPPPPREAPIERKPEGEACSSDGECFGRCDIPKDAKSGSCIKQCRLEKPVDIVGRPSASASAVPRSTR